MAKTQLLFLMLGLANFPNYFLVNYKNYKKCLKKYVFSVVFCDAYRKKVYGEKFQWLIVGMYESDWWRREDPSLECTSEQVG